MGKETTLIGRTRAEEEMRQLGAALAACLREGDVVVLTGELGAGKTHLTQGVARGLGIQAPVTSPTFNVVTTYEAGALRLNHFDLYRLEDASALDDVGFRELAGPGSGAVALVEWGDRFPERLPAEHLDVELAIASDGTHEVRAQAVGARARELLEGWVAATRAACGRGGCGAAGTTAERCSERAPLGRSAAGASGEPAGPRANHGAPDRCGDGGLPGRSADPAADDAAAEGCLATFVVHRALPADARCVLAFDTANEVVAVGLGALDEGRRSVEPVATVELQARRESNTRLLPLVDELMARAGAARSQLACVAVGVGPGSFTGVRIAVATAKGIASALGVGLVGLSTSDAVAWGAWLAGARGSLLVVADAMRKEVYPVRYGLEEEGAVRKGPDAVVAAEEAARACAGSPPSLLAGDALGRHGELFEGCAPFAERALWTPSAAGLLAAAQALWREGSWDPFDGRRHAPGLVLPVYTRLSDAEENERTRLASPEPRNLRTGVQDAPAPDGGIGRATMHSASGLGAPAAAEGDAIRLAPLDSAHAAAVAALEHEAMGTDAWSEALVADELPRRDRTWWAAYAGEELVGYAGGMVVGEELQVLKVAVAPAWRRRGIARRLCERIAEDARNLGAVRCSLEVRASNAGAQGFYESLGLGRLGTRPRYYSDREDAVLMASDQLPVPAKGEAAVAGMALERHGETVGHDGALSEPLILAIESSCDETAAALVDGTGRLLSDVVASQVDFHGRFGGVVPEIASRKHIEAICGVCEECLESASAQVAGQPSLGWGDVQAVAATYAPGLMGALVVGVAFAKGAAWALDVPFIGVNHLEGHLYANRLSEEGFAPPAVVSLVSGGNTMLVSMRGFGDYEVLGETIDDAVGEAFDKVAKALGLGYPGGPAVSREAAKGDPEAVAFPRPLLRSGDLRFSLSGLKTAVVNHIAEQRRAGRPLDVPGICASFQAAVVDVQVAKARMALERTGAPTLCVGGGVAANAALREAYERLCAEMGVHLVVPPLSACGDNAGMIALVALDRFRAGRFFPLSADAHAHADLGEPY